MSESGEKPVEAGRKTADSSDEAVLEPKKISRHQVHLKKTFGDGQSQGESEKQRMTVRNSHACQLRSLNSKALKTVLVVYLWRYVSVSPFSVVLLK